MTHPEMVLQITIDSHGAMHLVAFGRDIDQVVSYAIEESRETAERVGEDGYVERYPTGERSIKIEARWLE